MLPQLTHLEVLNLISHVVHWLFLSHLHLILWLPPSKEPPCLFLPHLPLPHQKRRAVQGWVRDTFLAIGTQGEGKRGEAREEEREGTGHQVSMEEDEKVFEEGIGHLEVEIRECLKFFEV